MLDDNEILNIISNELSNSAGGGDSIESNRKDALSAYLGHSASDGTAGKSSVVSTDVADAIEWIMPEIVKAFTQNNEVVTFDATFQGDEKQAEIESQFVYDVLMKDNNGFLIIHQFVKDALLQKNGFVKVFYSDDKKISTESYTGLTEPELQLLLSDPETELIEQTVDQDGEIPIFDIKLTRTKDNGKVEICSVPPEEFRVSKMHNKVDLADARFSAHILLKTASELISLGYDKAVIDTLSDGETADRDYRFSSQGEDTSGDYTVDDSQRLIEIAECYIHIDIEGSGVSELMKITVAGGDNPTEVLDIEPIAENPFISSTAILMSHKLFGISIYDRLREIQDQKTALWRNILDNMYLQNNQRTIAVEGQVNLDDLLISRPGGIIRVKRLDAISPYSTPPLSSDSYKMMDYLDQVRAGRAGVSPEGGVTDGMVGDRVGSEGIDRMMNQKEELVGLMIRVFAETGIKPLCYMIRRNLIKHQDVISDYKFRGDWVEVDPSIWNDRPRSTVRVGTGSGNRKEQISVISQFLMMQEKILMNPSQALVKESNVYAALNDLGKFSGMPGASDYFIDPSSKEGKENKANVDKSNQSKQQMEIQERKMLAEAQAKIAAAEESKANTASQNIQLKAQIEQGKLQAVAAKTQADSQIAILKQQLNEAEAIASMEGDTDNLQFKYWETKQRMALERERIRSTEKNNEQVNDDEQGDDDE